MRNFDELITESRSQKSLSRLVIAAAEDIHAIEAVMAAKKLGLTEPLFVGDETKIRKIFDDLNLIQPESDFVFNAPDPEEASRKAVELVCKGQADFLMKGAVDSKKYLGAVVDKQSGLGTGRLMSHFSILEIPGYHKLIAPVDGGMVPYPDLKQKKEIILNSVEVFHKLGYTEPKVAVLACTEKANSKMPETIDAEALTQMNKKGEIRGCIIEGPVSYDCAMSKEIANEKGYYSIISGDVDILIAPNIHAGNIMGKIFTVTCQAKMAGIIVGARCPIVMTSRASSGEEKLLSIALASIVASSCSKKAE